MTNDQGHDPDYQPPNRGTEAASRYFEAAFATIRFLGFLVDTAHSFDRNAELMRNSARRLRAAIGDPLGTTLGEDSPKSKTRMKLLGENAQLLMQMFLARFVDNFQAYVVDLVRAVLVKQPSILTSNQPQLSLEYAFQFSTMEEMKADLIERKVSSLSYQGLAQLRDWCSSKGIAIVIAEADVSRLTELIETRNVIAHNRGFIDSRYIRHLPGTIYRSGELRRLDPNEVNEAFALLNRVVRETDHTVAIKFGLGLSRIELSEQDEGPFQGETQDDLGKAQGDQSPGS